VSKEKQTKNGFDENESNWKGAKKGCKLIFDEIEFKGKSKSFNRKLAILKLDKL
jgi:hypothetical protein